MEIKFRAWVVPNYPEPMVSGEPYMAIQGDPDLETLQSFMHHYGDENNLMLWTGLKDKNLKDIYESDKVKYQHSKDSKEYTGTVVWRNDFASFWLQTEEDSGFALLGQQKIIEVIGNIYE